MKKFTVAIILIVISVSQLLAIENSVTFMPLTSSSQFMNRVAYILAQEAPVILTEAGTGTYTASCHTLRANLAASVSRGPAGYVPIFAIFLTTNINVVSGGALTGAGNTLDTPATDASLLAAIASLWSTVAGCITNP